MNKSTLPATTQMLTALNLKSVKYFPGKPRTYRFNAKEGIFFNDLDQKLGKAGSGLKLIPLSYRTFFAEMFKMDHREWLEIFFLNGAGHVCSLLLHRYSVGQFADLSARLFYEEASPVEIELEIKPDPRQHPEHGKYYVAQYDFEVLPEKVKKLSATILKSLPPVYRRDTALATEAMNTWLGYPDLSTLDLGLPAPSTSAKAA